MEEVVEEDASAEEDHLGLDGGPLVDGGDGTPTLPPITHTLRPHSIFPYSHPLAVAHTHN